MVKSADFSQQQNRFKPPHNNTFNPHGKNENSYRATPHTEGSKKNHFEKPKYVKTHPEPMEVDPSLRSGQTFNKKQINHVVMHTGSGDNNNENFRVTEKQPNQT